MSFFIDQLEAADNETLHATLAHALFVQRFCKDATAMPLRVKYATACRVVEDCRRILLNRYAEES